MSKKKNNQVEVLAINFVASVIDLFVTALVSMLILGTLLGNAGLWTPAYWECFGALYLVSALTGFATRAYYSTLKVLIRQDAQRNAVKVPTI